MQYKPSGSDPSRMVVYDRTIGEHGSLRYVATAAGTHTVRFEWGDSARIDLYLES